METNKIVTGDALQLLKDIPDDTFDGVVTDPPYGISYYSNRSKTEEYRKRVRTVVGIDNDDLTGFVELASALLPELYRVLKDDTPMLWFTSWKTLNLSANWIESAGFTVKNAIIWDKVSKGMGDLRGAFGNAYEIILFAAKGRPLIIGERVRDIYTVPRVSAASKIHAHQKPVELLEYWMRRTVGCPDKIILDPCAGSGSTVIASMSIGNQCVAMEIDEIEAGKGNARIEDFTKAVGGVVIQQELKLHTMVLCDGWLSGEHGTTLGAVRIHAEPKTLGVEGLKLWLCPNCLNDFSADYPRPWTIIG